MFVAFSCKQRCTCPSCHQKRARPGVPGAPTSIHVAEEVCAPVAHRQVVLTIPKRLRLHTRFDRQLLGKLCTCAWNCIQAEVRRLLGRDDVVPGMVGAIQRGTRSRVAANCCTGIRTSTRWSLAARLPRTVSSWNCPNWT